MNLRKLSLIEEAKKSFGSLSINEALLAYLRRFYNSTTSVAELVSKYLNNVFNVYNFDGVDDYAVLPFRAINPDGDIDIEFQTGPVVPAAGGGVEYTVVSQCLTTTFANKEFNLYFNSTFGALQMQVGGSYAPSAPLVILAPNTKYRALLVGTSLQYFANGIPLNSVSFTRGAAREPAAQTVLMASTHGAPTTFRAFGRGIFYNIRINGILYPMADRNQTIQLPSPSGLGAELITPTVLENPFSKGSQWSYLGNGRWQYVGDGTFNEIQFIAINNQPNSCYLEFEVESITGQMRCCPTATGVGTLQSNPTFSSVGVFRYFITDRATLGNGFRFARASVGAAASCIIKNISFKPLSVVNSTELVSNGDFSAGTAGWTQLGSATLTVSSGQASVGFVAGQNSRIERGAILEANQYYQVSADVISISGVTNARLMLIRGAAGSYATVGQADISSAGKISFVILSPATDAIISLRTADGTNSGTIVWDNVSLRKLDSLCNPMTLVNTTSDRWQEVPQ